MANPSKITNEWLQGEILDLFHEAKNTSPIDHGICVQYLNLLFRTMPEEEKQKAVEVPEGRRIADESWKADSARKEKKP